MIDLKLITDFYSVPDRLEDLMYRLISMIESLQKRQHRVLIYQQADKDYFKYLHTQRLTLLQKYPNFINGLNWCSIRWQHTKGVPINEGNYTSKYGDTPEEIRHRKSGVHQILNKFLTTYIKENKILE